MAEAANDFYFLFLKLMMIIGGFSIDLYFLGSKLK